MTLSPPRAIAIDACVVALLGLGAVIAQVARKDPPRSGPSLAVEGARNTATAQAACYSAGGTWKAPAVIGHIYPVGAEVQGTCTPAPAVTAPPVVSASETADRRARAEAFFNACCITPSSKSNAAAKGETTDAYCFRLSEDVRTGKLPG